ncbi:MAG TPA: hypothetical protein PKH77_01170 [Anaerolineae bacterium]|nr:hypothetical protein [Anaerolineae bacterium]
MAQSSRPHSRAPYRLTRAWRLALCVLAALLGVGLSYAISLAQTATGAVGVYYNGVPKQTGETDDPVLSALRLAAPYIVLVDQPDLAQVVVVHNQHPTSETLRLNTLVRQGKVGLIVFNGPIFPTNVLDLNTLLGVSAFGMARTERPETVMRAAEADPLQMVMAWESAPVVRARTVISNPNLLLPIIVTPNGEPILQRGRGRETTQIFFVSPWLSDAQNADWLNWPYFRYFIYRLVIEAAGSSRGLSYADYPLSPTPQGPVRRVVIGVSLGLALLVAIGFYSIERHLYLNPGGVDRLRKTAPATAPRSGWRAVGFHRPLAGLLCLFPLYLALFPLLLWYRVLGLPQILLPWMQPLQFWEQVTRWLEAAWLVFDLGTGTAAVYHFAAYRPHHPRTAFQHFQFYLWWQLFSGVVQLVVVTALATLVFPQTALAHLSYYFLLRGLLQFPGFLHCFGLFFRALQRLDYEQWVNLTTLSSAAILPGIGALWLRQWGAAQPAVGAALGSVMGLNVGLLLAEWLGFGVGWLLYRRLGFVGRAVLLPRFDRRVLLRMLSFGGRLTFGRLTLVGGMLFQLGWLTTALPATMTRTHLMLATTLVAAFEVLASGLYAGLMPAFVEALTMKYETLLRYYAGQGIRYGMWFSLFLLGTLGTVIERGLVDLFGIAAEHAAPWGWLLLIWGALQGMVWLPDRLLEASNHPALVSWLIMGETAARTGLLVLLTPYLGPAGVVFAYGWARALRGLLSWMAIGRVSVRPHIYLWQTLIAPAAAAGLLYYGLTRVWIISDLSGAPLTLWHFALATLPTLTLYGFLTALFGGWDDDGVAELQQAVRLSGLSWPVAWLLQVGVQCGARLSPLHGRFPIALRPMALEEAQSLTLARVPMD